MMLYIGRVLFKASISYWPTCPYAPIKATFIFIVVDFLDIFQSNLDYTNINTCKNMPFYKKF
jgi:hypothetical protein